MDRLPIFLSLRGVPCLVVGGGAVAARKARQLASADALVTVVAPRFGPEMRSLIDLGEVFPLRARFEPAVLEGRQFVIAATDEPETNRAVAEEARRRRLLVNVVDQPELGNFILPAMVDRSPIVVAIGTSGTAPALASLIREKIESLLSVKLGRFARLMGAWRETVARVIPQAAARRKLWRRLAGVAVGSPMLDDDDDRVNRFIAEEIRRAAGGLAAVGEVYIVGAGPGDPGLLTARALQLMQQCDVVLHDCLVPPAILDLVRAGTERLNVGKRSGAHRLSQQALNQLMVELACAGKRVLRLKGGDPSIFGRLGEETEALAAAGIPYQVVPGVTAASGAAAYAGIPLTHRDYSGSCVFVNGHGHERGSEPDWPRLARPGQTVVFYMAARAAATICRTLQEHGLAPETPAALIANGTTPDQDVVSATVATLPEELVSRPIGPPALLIVGEVCRLREKLSRFHPDGAKRGKGSPTLSLHPIPVERDGVWGGA